MESGVPTRIRDTFPIVYSLSTVTHMLRYVLGHFPLNPFPHDGRICAVVSIIKFTFTYETVNQCYELHNKTVRPPYRWYETEKMFTTPNVQYQIE